MPSPFHETERSTRPYRELPELHRLLDTMIEFDEEAPQRPSLAEALQHIHGEGRYVRGEEVGRGAMGTVFKAEDRDLGRTVAWKQLRREGSTMRAKRFVHEAQLMGQLEHPGILPVHELGVVDRGEFYYVMRYVRGDTTLQHVISSLQEGDPQAHAYFTMERRVRIIQQVADTLYYAHRKGVVHRDIKPANIMVGSQGQVYVVDWGLAKVDSKEDESGEVPLQVENIQTAPGAIIGTPLYMSPEQLYGKVDPRADIYSLCTVLYELLSLHHPLWDEPPEEMSVLTSDLMERVPTPAEDHWSPLNRRVPRALSLTCAKGLAKTRGDRFQSMKELELELQSWAEGRGPVVCTTTFMIRALEILRRQLDARPRLFTALVVVALTLCLVSAVVAVWAVVTLGGH